VLVAADTDVVVRLLVSDDLVQQRAVVARLKRIEASNGRVLVSPVVLAEVAWVLESAYGYRREEVVAAIAALVATPPFVADEPGVVADTLAQAANHRVEMADALVLAIARSRGATTLLTFDRKVLRLSGCVRP